MSAVPTNIVELIRASGVATLPDNPSAKGYSASQIKAALQRTGAILAKYLLQVDQAIEFGLENVKLFVTSLGTASNYEEGQVAILYASSTLTFYVNVSSVWVQIGDDVALTANQIDDLQTAVNLINNTTIPDAITECKGYTDTEVNKFLDGDYIAYKAKSDDDGNDIVDTYETKTDASSKLVEAKSYADASETDANSYTDTQIANAISDLKSNDVPFAGNVSIGGNLTINGTISHVDSTTVSTGDRFIQMLKGNTVAVSGYVGMVVPKYDGTHDFFFGVQGDTMVLGDVTATFNDDGDVTAITDVSLVPLAGRSSSAGMVNGNLPKWDSANDIFIDSGVSATDYATAESARVSAENARVLAEGARVLAESGRVSAEAIRQDNLENDIINYPYPITQAEYTMLSNGGVFGVHLDSENNNAKVVTVYASRALAEAAEETYIFEMQSGVQYPASDVGGDSVYLNIPAAPATDGTYALKCTVSSGTVAYSWEADA